MTRFCGLLVFAIAVLPHTFTLGLPFQLDDYHILPPVSAMFDSPLPLAGAYFYRPTGWVLWALLIKLGGGYAIAPLFHGVLLGLHGLTALLLFRVLRNVAREPAAFAGAALFGLMPGGIQAVSWISGGGDQLLLLFLVLAVLLTQRFLRTGRFSWLPFIAACAFASFLAKESMIALLPAAALGLWSVPRGARAGRPWAPVAAMVLGLVLAMLLRCRALGTFGAGYAFEVTFELGHLARLPAIFLQMIVPWSQAPDFSTMLPKIGTAIGGALGIDTLLAERTAVAVLLGLPVLAGVIAGRPRPGVPDRATARLGWGKTAVAAAAVLSTLIVALLPIVLIWPKDPIASNLLSRTVYGPSAILGALVAVAVSPLFGRRMGRILATASLLVLATLEIDLGRHVARTEMLAGAAVQSRLESLEQIAREEPAPVLFAVVDPEVSLGGLPLIDGGVVHALAKPFSRADRSVTWWRDLATLSRAPLFRLENAPVRILEVKDGRFVRVGETLPALAAETPLLRAAAGRAGVFTFDQPVPVRAVAAVRLTVRAGTDAAACWWDTGGEPVKGELGRAAGTTWVAPAPEPETLADLATGRIRGLRLEGVEIDGTPEVVRVLPHIELELPIAGHTLLAGSLPRIEFAVPFDAIGYRITFRFLIGTLNVPAVYDVARDRLERIGDGRYRFVPAASDQVRWPGSHPYDVRWDTFGEVFKREIASRGGRSVTVDFRVESLGPEGPGICARSDWDTLEVLAP